MNERSESGGKATAKGQRAAAKATAGGGSATVPASSRRAAGRSPRPAGGCSDSHRLTPGAPATGRWWALHGAPR
jgi:hypothetical protein